jgi:hypothetical protein
MGQFGLFPGGSTQGVNVVAEEAMKESLGGA